MRLTADLVSRAPNFLNPLRERELDLRGNKLTVIENLGATEDRNDCIDLSDNQIAILENFPLLNRLKMLLLNNNKVSKIIIGLGSSLPNLETLVLTNNKLLNLADIDALAEFPSLVRLSLLENPITKKPHFRLYVIHKLPNLKLLDFKKVKEQERTAAEKMFGPVSKGQPAQKLSKADEEAKRKAEKQAQEVAAREKAKEVEAIKSAISTATSLAEVDRLSQALQTGHLPQEGDHDAMEQ